MTSFRNTTAGFTGVSLETRAAQAHLAEAFLAEARPAAPPPAAAGRPASGRRPFASARRGLAVAAAAVLAVAAGASPASAGLTELRTTPYPAEQGQGQILSHTYGGTFVASGTGFTNGTVTATRVDDLTDVAWTGHQVSLTPIASFAGSGQQLGFLAGTQGGAYQNLFAVNQFGYLPTGSTDLDLSGKDVRFALTNGVTNTRSSSLTADNKTGDQLITYKVDGLGGKDSTYLLFWEDAPLATGDRDYNDLVVQAKFAGPGGPHAVPLPPAAATGLLVLGGLAGVRQWKRWRQARAA